MINLSASTAAMAATKYAANSLTLDHSCLLETDSESVCFFLQKYDQYANEVQARARKISTGDLKFYADVEF